MTRRNLFLATSFAGMAAVALIAIAIVPALAGGHVATLIS